MKELYLTEENGISKEQFEKQLDDFLMQYPKVKKVLIIPPDFTRCYSYAGEITQYLYKKLSASAEVDVMPALGTHMAMNGDAEIFWEHCAEGTYNRASLADGYCLPGICSGRGVRCH